jgi:hypothetical protein
MKTPDDAFRPATMIGALACCCAFMVACAQTGAVHSVTSSNQPIESIVSLSAQDEQPQTNPSASGASSAAVPSTRYVQPEEHDNPLRFAAGGGVLVGPVDGYVQTPLGGSPGSTSHQRPRLGELGIHHATIGEFGVSAIWGPHEVFGGGEIIQLSGTESLRSDLTTHGVNFASGTVISSDVDLDWYRIGYRHHFDLLPTPNGFPQLALSPYADGVVWNFDYSIEGGGKRTSRSYLKPTAQLGLAATWQPGAGPFALMADVASAPPAISSVPFIAIEQIGAKYRIAHTSAFDVSSSVGVRFEQLNYFDHQRVPNHIRANLGPLLIVGFGIGF